MMGEQVIADPRVCGSFPAKIIGKFIKVLAVQLTNTCDNIFSSSQQNKKQTMIENIDVEQYESKVG